MARLILKEFRCVRESDEGGSDSPYFLVMVAHPLGGDNERLRVYGIQKDSWVDDTGEGELKTPNHTVELGITTTNVGVLVALMERDWGTDVHSSDIETYLRTVLDSMVGPNGAGGTSIANAMRDAFRSEIRRHRDNDEFLGTAVLEITTLDGLLPLLNFYGDGSHYRVRFEMRP